MKNLSLKSRKHHLTVIVIMLLFSSCLIFGGFYAKFGLVKASGDTTEINLITASDSEDWFQEKDGEGSFNVDLINGKIETDTLGAAFGLEGATYLSKKAKPLGAFEISTNVKVRSLKENAEVAFVGLLPWYIDKNNYLSVQLKITTLDEKDGSGQYIKSPAEIEQGCAIEQIIVTGKLNGEDKYKDPKNKEANTSFYSNVAGNLQTEKKDVMNADGHNLKVKFENSGASGDAYKVSIYYEDSFIGDTSIYFYPANVQPYAGGIMAQDTVADFSNLIMNDYSATHNTIALARDWTQKNGFTYRMLNAKDVWMFNSETITVDSTKSAATENKSEYKVTGTNYAGYDTARGFTANPNAVSEDLPQNYEVKATVKADIIPLYTQNKAYKMGYGLIPWYKDDLNYVDVMFRKSISGSPASATIVKELVLYGWIGGSNLPVGTNTYKLPDNFDMLAEHTIRVEKKSTEFFVYLDDGAEPVITKRVQGSGENFSYGYTGFNIISSYGKIISKPIYSAYDEISIYDNDKSVWKSSSNSKTSWDFSATGLTLSAKEASSAKGNLSYLIGGSDVHAANIELETTVKIDRNVSQMSQLMLAPYMFDENNYVRIGLFFDNDKTFARIRSSEFTDDDEEEGNEPNRVLKQTEIADVNLSQPIKINVVKIGNTVTLKVNDAVVYGKKFASIDKMTSEIGIYAYNADMIFTPILTKGYKKYEKSKIGDWVTSGVSKYGWTIDENGKIIGDNRYGEIDPIVEDDEGKIYAVKEHPQNLAENYTMTVKAKRLAYSRAQDRIGVMCWYLDDNNYLVYMLDHWRSDSPVGRTTFWGKINGNNLPLRYTHGGWMPEGDTVGSSGLTPTQESSLELDHTFTVQKEGNQFTCYVDDNKAKLSISVELPNFDASKKIYSGMYVLNDQVEFSEYGVYANGTERAAGLPALPEQATNMSSEVEPTLPQYNQSEYTDEFDGTTDNERKPSEPETPDKPDPAPDKNKKGCAIVTAGDVGGFAGGIMLLSCVLLVALSRKKIKKESN